MSFRILAAAVLLTLCGTPAVAQTADEIVEKHLAALGGREALGRIRSRVATGTIALTLPVAELKGTVESFAKAPNKSRTLVKLDLSGLGGGEVVNDQRFDGSSGFVLDSFNGDREVTGAQLDVLRNASFPTSWLDYRERGLSISVTGTESLGGRQTFVLETTPQTGPRVRTWVDADTYMILKTSVTVPVPELGGDTEQITEFSDFKHVDGVIVPFAVKSINSVQTAAATLTSVTHNVDIDDASFMKPPGQ